MIEVKKFIGHFTCSVYSNYTYKKLSIYELIFESVFNQKKAENAQLFFDKVDDFVYVGAHSKYDKNGVYRSTYIFLVRVNDRVGIVDENLNILLPIEYKEIIPPININDAVFVVKNTQNKWGVVNIITNAIIVPFGKFQRIWGYDTHHALVCTGYENIRINRAIIDVRGNFVKNTGQYGIIYPFYGTGVEYILVTTKSTDKDAKGYAQAHYKLLSKENPASMYWPNIEVTERPREYINHYRPTYDKMDAYEGDYDALWNTD